MPPNEKNRQKWRLFLVTSLIYVKENQRPIISKAHFNNGLFLLVNQVYMYINALSCCGIKEIDGLRKSPSDNIKGVAYLYKIERVMFRYVIFSDIRGSRKHTKLAKFIEDNNLGTTTTLPASTNPNSGNTLQVYLWKIDWRRVSGFLRRNGINNEKLEEFGDEFVEYGW